MEFRIGYRRDPSSVKLSDGYEVGYTSSFHPCKSAYQKKGILVDETLSIDQDYVDLKFYPAFTAQGINHRVSKGANGDFYLERQVPDLTWYVELNSLEDLLALQDEIGTSISINHSTAHGLHQRDYSTNEWVHTDIPKQYYIIIDWDDRNEISG